MTHSIKQTIVLSFCAVFFIGVFSACNDDDENAGPAPIVFPHTMTFDNIQQQSLQLWVGGDAVSTGGIAPEDLIPAEGFEPLSQEWFVNSVFIFTADSVTSPEDPTLYHYFFSNDTLYVELDVFGNVLNIPLGTGSLYELRVAQGYYRYCQISQSIQSCESLGTNSHFSLETVLDANGLSSLDNMGASDSLLIYNQVVVFKP